MSTYFLKLTKPVIGTTNWGASINQNWDKIDRGFGQINQNLLALQDKMTDIGSFSFIQAVRSDNTVVTLDFALLTEFYCYDTNSNTWHKVTVTAADAGGGWVGTLSSSISTPQYRSATMGKLIIGNKLDDGVTESMYVKHTDIDPYDNEYDNSGSSQTTQLSSLSDYTAFLVALPNKWMKNNAAYQPIGAMQCYAFGEMWTGSDIMIKTSLIQNNTRVTLIRKFKQSLGGYYTPAIDPAQPNCIVWSKASSSEAIPQYKTIIPHNLWEGALNEIEIEQNTATTINTGQATERKDSSSGYTYQQNLADICFWRQSGNKRTRIYLDYWTTVIDNQLCIQWESNVLKDKEQYVITYVLTQWDKNSGGQ